MNIIVLAGGKNVKQDSNDQTVQNDSNSKISNKALIKIKNKYMIEYVIDTINKSSLTDKITLVGPVEQLKPILKDRVDYYIEGTDSLVDNILLGLEQNKNEKQVVITTSDIPMLTVEALDDFITKAIAADADMCYSVVDKKINDKKYPEVKRTYVRLKDGTYTGGNIFTFNPAATDKCRGFVEKMLAYRKNPVKMASVLGFGFIVQLAFGVLTIEAIQKKCEKLMGIKGAVVISEYPEVGNDVDKVSDIKFVEKYIS